VKRFKYFLAVLGVLALLLPFSAVDVTAQPGPPLNRPNVAADAFCAQCCQAVFLACKAECFAIDDGIFPACVQDALYAAGYCLYAEGQCLDEPGDYDCSAVDCDPPRPE
jgi:hypothetical protein